MAQPRVAREGPPRALELAAPAVGRREPLGLVRLGRREQGERAQPLALARRMLEVPGEPRERPATSPPAHVLGVEQRDHLVPERARLARAPLVGGGLAHERQPAGRARAGGVEEVALALDGVRAHEARTGGPVELAARIVVEERRGVAAPRQRSLLEAEQEHGLEAARPRAREIEDRDPPALERAAEAHLAPLEHRDDVVRRELAAEALPAVELGEQLADRVVRAQVAPRGLADGRRLHTVRASHHRGRQRPHRLDRPGGRAQELERRERLPVAQPDRLLLDDVARGDGASAQPPFEEVDVRAREAGEGRAEERVEVAAAALLPGEAEQRQQGLPERRLAEPEPALDGEGDAERAEHRLDRGARALDGRDHERDLLQRDAGGGELPNLLRDELERAARAGRLEEADRAVERRRVGRRIVVEEVPLEVRERRRRVLPRARGKLLDRAAGQRRKILLRPAQRREGGTARLVGQRDRDLRARGQRLQQPPFGSRQVLEPVREHGPAVPRVELRREPLDGAPAEQVAVPEADRVELLAIRRVQAGEVAVAGDALERASVQQARLELREDAEQRICEPGEARRTVEAGERGALERAARDERPLRLSRHRAHVRGAARQLAEQVVEGPDRAREERSDAPQEVSLDPVDVGPVRDDQDGIAVERGEIAVEEVRDLAGLRRPEDEAETHGLILVLGFEPLLYALRLKAQRAGNGGGTVPPAGYALADFGRRPRRATWRPPSFSASASVTSSSRTPLRASWKVMRIVAPLPSGISEPDMSETRTVLRATANTPWRRNRRRQL